MKGNKIIRSSQYSFTNEKSGLTNLINFCDKMIGLIDKGRTVDTVYLGLSEAFDTVSHKICDSVILRANTKHLYAVAYIHGMVHTLDFVCILTSSSQGNIQSYPTFSLRT